MNNKNNLLIRFLLVYHAILHECNIKIVYLILNCIYIFLNQLIYSAYIPASAKLEKNIQFPHGFNGIFISGSAEVGEGCIIFQQVTIGSKFSGSRDKIAPIIGNNCIIGAGAKIIGNIRIGNNVRIASNVSINQDIPDNYTVVPSKPRFIIRNDG